MNKGDLIEANKKFNCRVHGCNDYFTSQTAESTHVLRRHPEHPRKSVGRPKKVKADLMQKKTFGKQKPDVSVQPLVIEPAVVEPVVIEPLVIEPAVVEDPFAEMSEREKKVQQRVLRQMKALKKLR